MEKKTDKKETAKKLWHYLRPVVIVLSSLIITLGSLVALCSIMVNHYISPVDKNDATPIEFVISDGWGASTIAKHLYEACGEGQP